jgi:hypothetical protein
LKIKNRSDKESVGLSTTMKMDLHGHEGSWYMETVNGSAVKTFIAMDED